MIMILHMYEVTTELILVAPVNSYDYLVLLDVYEYDYDKSHKTN